MIYDFHNDLLTSATAFSAIDAVGDNKVVCAVFKGKRNFMQVQSTCQNFIKLSKSNLKLAFENLDYTFCECQTLLSYKPVYASLTWNYENANGGGALVNAGITPKGKQLVFACNELGVAIDTAHASKRLFSDVIKYGERVVNSHCCFCEITEHPRNISLDMAKQIVVGGGLVGLCLYAPFLTNNKFATANDVFRHADLFCQKFGSSSLCFGTDFYGCENLPLGLENYRRLESLRQVFFAHGYSKCAVDGIFYNNLNRFVGGY